MLIKNSIIQLAEQSRLNYPFLDTVAEKKFLQCDFTTKDNFIKYGVYGGIVKQLFILVHASFKSINRCDNQQGVNVT